MMPSLHQRLAGAPILRVTIAVLVALDLLTLLFQPTPPAPAMGSLAAWLWQPAARAAVVVLGAGAAARFARAPGRLWSGTVALLSIGVCATLLADAAGTPPRNLYFSGLCLFGWLCGLAVKRDDESLAASGAIGLLGAAYCSAGLSKLAYSGPLWLSGVPVQAVVVSQDGLVNDGALGAIRVFVAESPGLSGVLATLAVALELAGPALLTFSWPRAVVATGLIAMHCAILALGGIAYISPMVLLLAVMATPPPLSAALAIPRWLQSRRSAGLVLLVLVLLATLAVWRQAAAARNPVPEYARGGEGR